MVGDDVRSPDSSKHRQPASSSPQPGICWSGRYPQFVQAGFSPELPTVVVVVLRLFTRSWRK